MRRPTRLEMMLLVLSSMLFLASAYFTQSYRDTSSELASLSRRVTAKEAEAYRAQQAAKLTEALKVELAELEAALTSPSKDHFPKEVDTVALVDLASSAGRQSGARLLSFQSLGAVKTKLAGRDYMMHRYEVKARGQLSQLGGFISSLETGSITPLAIEVGSLLSAGGDSWDMTLSIALFTQR